MSVRQRHRMSPVNAASSETSKPGCTRIARRFPSEPEQRDVDQLMELVHWRLEDGHHPGALRNAYALYRGLRRKLIAYLSRYRRRP
jgi:hypothetical protein